MTYVVILAFSGGIAGLLKRTGKIGVIIGFVIGNLYISYYANGFSELTMRVSELMIASISLLFMPKVIELKLDRLFNKNNSLSVPYENVLDSASNLKSRIGAVSEVFESLAQITIENTPEDEKETRSVIEKYITCYIENTCIDCKKKKSCLDAKNLNLTSSYISNKLDHNETINCSMLHLNCDSEEKIALDIQEIYNSMKLMRILKQREKEESKKLSNQYSEVSKILSIVAKNIKNEPIVIDKKQEKLRDELKFYGFIIYEDEFVRDGQVIEYTFITDILSDIDKQKKQIITIANDILEQNMTIKLILNSSKSEKSKIKIVSTPAFAVQTSIASGIKFGEEVSGDSYLSMELQDLKHMVLISDGAGSGIEASKSSSMVINMLEKLLEGGFNEEKAIEIINSVVKLKGEGQTSCTLDTVIVDLRSAQTQFIKIGSAPTYIIEDGSVITINNANIPMGIVKKTDYLPICRKIKSGSIIIQVSDGVIPDGTNIQNNYFIKYIQNMDAIKTSKSIADELYRLVLKENKEELKDDVTIVVTKVKSTL
ncbi:MAG: SpoIIE family protein phosphatase [Clostridia bacterium]